MYKINYQYDSLELETILDIPINDQKSTHFPLTYQSPYRGGSGPFGLKPYSGYIYFPLAIVGFVYFLLSTIFYFYLILSSSEIKPFGPINIYISLSEILVSKDSIIMFGWQC